MSLFTPKILRSIHVFVAKWLQKCGFLYMFSVDKYIYRLIDIKPHNVLR